MLAVSVDPPERARQVVENNDLSFSILCDTDREMIRDYGLVHEGGSIDGKDIPIPAHILIAPDGAIVWRFTSTRIQVRPSPADVLRAIDSQGWKSE